MDHKTISLFQIINNLKTDHYFEKISKEHYTIFH